jgi:hypothetical protein
MALQTKTGSKKNISTKWKGCSSRRDFPHFECGYRSATINMLKKK